MGVFKNKISKLERENKELKLMLDGYLQRNYFLLDEIHRLNTEVVKYKELYLEQLDKNIKKLTKSN